MAKSTTGPCEPYSDADLVDLGNYVVRVVDDTGQTPASITAQVEFHGVIARSNNGVRKFTLDQLTDAQKDRIVAAAQAAAQLHQAASQAQPKSTYQRKGWLARFRQLAGTVKGRAALQRAGVTMARITRSRWLAGTQTAGKDNQRAIARAYDEIRMENVHAADDRATEAVREVAETFDDVMSEAYGANGVRFRDIQE